LAVSSLSKCLNIQNTSQEHSIAFSANPQLPIEFCRSRLSGCDPKRASFSGSLTLVPNEYSIMDANTHGRKRFTHPTPVPQFALISWFRKYKKHHATTPDIIPTGGRTLWPSERESGGFARIRGAGAKSS
jgi:hypothetical protein